MIPTGGNSSPLGSYASGAYARDAAPYNDDQFKVDEFFNVFDRAAPEFNVALSSYVDIGCMRGGITAGVAAGLRTRNHSLVQTYGYDVSPEVLNNRQPGITFRQGDFTAEAITADLVTAFDVLEHVLRPVEFLRNLAIRAKFVALHIPLDDNWINGVSDRYRSRLNYPGHITFLSPASALNLLSEAGLRALDYSFTHGYRTESGHMNRSQQFLRPVRASLARMNEWMAARTVGGLSLMVLCATEEGLSTDSRFDSLGVDLEGFMRH